MPRFMCSYAANKRVEDGLKRKQEQIRLDYIRTTHRHLDETEKLVDDLIHINVRTPSAFEGDSPLTLNGIGGGAGPNNTNTCTVPKAAATYSHHHPGLNGSQQTLDSLKDVDSQGRRAFSSGLAPDNFRPGLSREKSVGQPVIQIRGNEVFYQYEKQRRNWKKVEPSYKTKLLLHRNNTVIKALSNFNARHDEAHEKPPSEDSNYTIQSTAVKRKSSVFPDSFRRDSLFPRRDSRRGSRYSHTLERKVSVPPVIEIPPQLSPGHTPRMLDGWTIMKWCLWNKKQMTPVWATRRYAEMKHREYQEFIASKKKTQEGQVTPKPGSAHATSSRKEDHSKDSLLEGNNHKSKLSLPRAKSVPVSKITTFVDDEDTEHFPSIDRGVIRPTTSILRTNTTDDATPREEEEARAKSTTRRRVALDNYVDNGKDLFPPNSNNHEDNENVIAERKNSTKHVGKTVNYDGRPVSIYTWDTLTEADQESCTSSAEHK